MATPILHLGYFGLEEISLKFQVFLLVYSLSIIIGYTIAIFINSSNNIFILAKL